MCNCTLHISLYIVYPLLATRPHLNAISKPLKPNPMAVHLVGSRQDTQAYLAMSFITPCMLNNTKAAHLNFNISPIASLLISTEPITTPFLSHKISLIFYALYARKFKGCAPELCISMYCICIITITGYKAALHQHFNLLRPN